MKKKNVHFHIAALSNEASNGSEKSYLNFWWTVSHSFHLHHRLNPKKNFDVRKRDSPSNHLRDYNTVARNSNSSSVKRFLPSAFLYATVTTASLRLCSIKTQAFTVPSALRAQRASTIVEFSWEECSDCCTLRARDTNAVRVLFNKPVSSRARERAAHANVCPKNMNSFVVLSVASHFLSLSLSIFHRVHDAVVAYGRAFKPESEGIKRRLASCEHIFLVYVSSSFETVVGTVSEIIRSESRCAFSFPFISPNKKKRSNEYCEWDTSKWEKK